MSRELTTTEEEFKPTENVDISTRSDGRTQIVFRKAVLKGKVSSSDVLNTILIAARMQAEKYIEKLSRGAPLEVQEVKALRELAEITKLEINIPQKPEGVPDSIEVETVKKSLYQALTDGLNKSNS